MESTRASIMIPVVALFVAFDGDNATMSSIGYFENHVSYFVQKPKKVDPIKHISLRQLNILIALKYILNKSGNTTDSSNIDLIIFRNKMKSLMKISFFLLSLVRNTCTAQVVTRRLTSYFTKTKLKRERFFGHFD